MGTNSPNPVPFSEPPYLCGLPSPYYTEAHRQFQKACRAFIWENLHSHAMEWEREGTVPPHVFEVFAKHNMLLPNLPSPLPVAWLKKLNIHDILGVRVEDWDLTYTGIYLDEVSDHALSCCRPIRVNFDLDVKMRAEWAPELTYSWVCIWNTTYAFIW